MKGTLISSEIAEPYAQALMSVAQGHRLADNFADTIRDFSRLLEGSPDLQAFISSPVVNEADQKAVIQRILGNDTNPYFVNFILLLIDKRRLIYLSAIFEQYLALYRKLTNTVLAEVTAASPLTSDQERRIEDDVKQRVGARAVDLKVVIDPNVLGGVIIKVGSQVFDASLRGQLRRIRLSLNSAA
jgi:F-type H+-transporting ATPase subunit delta